MSSRYVGHFCQDRWADPRFSSRYVGRSARHAQGTSPGAPGRHGRCHLRGSAFLGPGAGRGREGHEGWPSERDDGGPANVTNGPANVTPYQDSEGGTECGVVAVVVIRTTRPVGGRVVLEWRYPRSQCSQGGEASTAKAGRMGQLHLAAGTRYEREV